MVDIDRLQKKLNDFHPGVRAAALAELASLTESVNFRGGSDTVSVAAGSDSPNMNNGLSCSSGGCSSFLGTAGLSIMTSKLLIGGCDSIVEHPAKQQTETQINILTSVLILTRRLFVRCDA